MSSAAAVGTSSTAEIFREAKCGFLPIAPLSNERDIAKVQEWLGHANVSTTRLYYCRKTRPEDSSTFHVKY